MYPLISGSEFRMCLRVSVSVCVCVCECVCATVSMIHASHSRPNIQLMKIWNVISNCQIHNSFKYNFFAYTHEEYKYRVNILLFLIFLSIK